MDQIETIGYLAEIAQPWRAQIAAKGGPIDRGEDKKRGGERIVAVFERQGMPVQQRDHQQKDQRGYKRADLQMFEPARDIEFALDKRGADAD